VLTPAGPGSDARGLHAEYWINPHFAGEPSLVRIDRQVALNLGFFNYPGLNASLVPPPLEFNNIMSSPSPGRSRCSWSPSPSLA
jgi:hypothetical protein